MDQITPELLQKALEAGPWPFVTIIVFALLRKDLVAFFTPKPLTSDLVVPIVSPLMSPLVTLLTQILDQLRELNATQDKLHDEVLRQGGRQK